MGHSKISNLLNKEVSINNILSVLFFDFTFSFIPLTYIIGQLKYFSPVDIILLGTYVWLVFRFIFFYKRKRSQKVLRLTLIVFFIGAVLIFLNFVGAVLANLFDNNFLESMKWLFFLILSILYFIFMKFNNPLKKINEKCINLLNNQKEYFTRHKLKSLTITRIFLIGFICWLSGSGLFLFIPFTISTVKPATTIRSNIGNIGIWTYGKLLDESMENSSMYIDNSTLQFLGSKGIYLIYGIHNSSLGPNLIENLRRCQVYGVKVHLSITPSSSEYNFVNIWTFGNLTKVINNALLFLQNADLIGNPVTTITYDMEVMSAAHFSLYGLNDSILDKLNNYNSIEGQFVQYNNEIRQKYNLSIDICTNEFQGFDFWDGDNDISSLMGLMNYKNADMSYMVYRRDNLGMNFILDHCNFLKSGNTIILDSWKQKGDFCWNDVNSAIKDARFVLGYPGKVLNLQIWALWYFLKSFGMSGLYNFINQITSNPSTWPEIKVNNQYPYSFYSDLIFLGISYLDFYGPLFKMFYSAI